MLDRRQMEAAQLAQPSQSPQKWQVPRLLKRWAANLLLVSMQQSAMMLKLEQMQWAKKLRLVPLQPHEPQGNDEDANQMRVKILLYKGGVANYL
jgi:hypothetical protein